LSLNCRCFVTISASAKLKIHLQTTVYGHGRVPMFAPAYMGREPCFSNAFTQRTKGLDPQNRSIEGAAPHKS
jgi:hypothetical protein